jgi:hypothetical protein
MLASARQRYLECDISTAPSSGGECDQTPDGAHGVEHEHTS